MQSTHRRCLLLIRQHLAVSQLYDVDNGHMDLPVTRVPDESQATSTGDLLTQLLKPGQLLCVDLVDVVWFCQLISVHWLGWLEVLSRPRPRVLSTQPTMERRAAITLASRLRLHPPWRRSTSRCISCGSSVGR